MNLVLFSDVSYNASITSKQFPPTHWFFILSIGKMQKLGCIFCNMFNEKHNNHPIVMYTHVFNQHLERFMLYSRGHDGLGVSTLKFRPLQYWTYQLTCSLVKVILYQFHAVLLHQKSCYTPI
jgi:hypothetical protein